MEERRAEVPIRVLIVDDHPIVRQGLRQTLRGAADIELGGEAATAREAMHKVRSEDWSLVILDLCLPDREGLDLLEDIRNERPEIPVLVLSMRPEEQFGLRTLRAGACGFMTKETAPDELLTAIRKVCAGGRYVSPALAERLAFAVDRPSGMLPHETLSDREYQVLCLIASGRTVREIAAQLHLSQNTVSTYRARILMKLKLRTNAELMRYAIANRLVE